MTYVTRLAEQRRLFGDVGSNLPRIVSRQQFCSRSTAGVILEIDISQRLAGPLPCQQFHRDASAFISVLRISLEDAFWMALKEIAVGRNSTLSDVVGEIDSGRPHGNLSSTIRLFVLDHYRAKTNGHTVESSGQTSLMITPATVSSVLQQ